MLKRVHNENQLVDSDSESESESESTPQASPQEKKVIDDNPLEHEEFKFTPQKGGKEITLTFQWYRRDGFLYELWKESTVFGVFSDDNRSTVDIQGSFVEVTYDIFHDTPINTQRRLLPNNIGELRKKTGTGNIQITKIDEYTFRVEEFYSIFGVSYETISAVKH
jgi:hypothetical protein